MMLAGDLDKKSTEQAFSQFGVHSEGEAAVGCLAAATQG